MKIQYSRTLKDGDRFRTPFMRLPEMPQSRTGGGREGIHRGGKSLSPRAFRVVGRRQPPGWKILVRVERLGWRNWGRHWMLTIQTGNRRDCKQGQFGTQATALKLGYADQGMR